MLSGLPSIPYLYLVENVSRGLSFHCFHPLPCHTTISDWRQLYRALRKADSGRQGSLDRQAFARHMADFGVPLTDEELTYLQTTMGAISTVRRLGSMTMSRRGKGSRPRPSSALLRRGDRSARRWDASLRRGNALSNSFSSNRPASAAMTRSLSSMGQRRIRYPEFMKRFVTRVSTAGRKRRTDYTLTADPSGTRDLSSLLK